MEYASLALTFAELSASKGLWKNALEGWNVRKSELLEQSRNEGRLELLNRMFEKRFQSVPPADLIEKWKQASDLDQVLTWTEALLQAITPEAYRQFVLSGKPPAP